MSRRGLSQKQRDIMKFFPSITFDRSSKNSNFYYYMTESKMYINWRNINATDHKIQINDFFKERPEKIVVGNWEDYHDPEDVTF